MPKHPFFIAAGFTTCGCRLPARLSLRFQLRLHWHFQFQFQSWFQAVRIQACRPASAAVLLRLQLSRSLLRALARPQWIARLVLALPLGWLPLRSWLQQRVLPVWLRPALQVLARSALVVAERLLQLDAWLPVDGDESHVDRYKRVRFRSEQECCLAPWECFQRQPVLLRLVWRRARALLQRRPVARLRSQQRRSLPLPPLVLPWLLPVAR